MKIKRWHIWIGIAISAIFLYLALRGIDIDRVWGALKEANFWWLIPGLAFYFLGVFFRAWRWQLLLKPIDRISIKILFPIINIGYMGNNIYPARAGELLRAIVLKKYSHVSVSGSLATIVVERLFDAIVVLGFVILNLSQLFKTVEINGLANVLRSLAIWGAGLFTIILLFFFLAAFFTDFANQIFSWIIAHLFPKKWRVNLMLVVEKFLEGLASLKSPSQTLMIFAMTILIWLLETGLYWGVNMAMGLGLNFLQLMLLNGAVNLVLLIPAAPGGLGTFDAASKEILEVLGIQSNIALGYTLVLRVALWIPITALGAFYFIREGFRWNLDIEAIKSQDRSLEKESDSDAKT